MSDPFVIVQDDVVSSFDQATTLLASWQRLHGKRRTAQEENEYQYMTDELHSTLKSLNSDLDDLQETIDVAKDFPEDYGLTAAKLADRQRFVTTKSRDVESMRQTLLSKPATKQSAGASLVHGGGSAQSEHLALEISNHQNQQQLLMEQQDEHFDAMLGTVRNLHGIASTMNTELDSQAVLIDEVNDLVDRTHTNLRKARKAVDKFLRDKSNRSLQIILLLFAAILVLIMLIIFT
ncbi:Syntaxin-10 [Coemansia sp. Benny D115]|nr:Syntaxin-10 [Coemansia sp. Benny D115]